MYRNCLGFITKQEVGFIHVPIILLIAAIVGVGTVTVVNNPNVLKDVAEKLAAPLDKNQESGVRQEVLGSLPAGTASSDEILVGFRNNIPQHARELVHQKTNGVARKSVRQINTDVVKVPQGSTVSETIEKYKKLPEVEYAEPNFLAKASLTPSDTLFGKQWNLKKILSEESYDISKGGGVVIAVVDTGVDNNHSDLSGLVLQGYNAIDGSNNSTDDHGHGTHVAGIASAQTDNGNGVASVSFQSQVLPVKVLNKDGVGTYGDVSEGITYSADNGARIINLSLGGSSDSETLKRAVNYALSKGSLLVAAAGNDGNDAPVYPAAYKGVLAVSASDSNDNLASFSSYGNNIFVSSPGVSVISSVPGGSYASWSGTSMAAPHLAGLLALQLSYKPSMTNSEAIDAVKKNAEKVGPYSYDQNGWNPYFGYGRISAGKTLTSLSSPSPSPTAEPSNSPARLPKQAQVPAKYSFTFDLQGTVESVDILNSRFVAKVEGGTPEVMSNVSGNLVYVYVDGQTRIKYQNEQSSSTNRNLSLNELSNGARINVKGNVTQNKLIALEVLVQYIPQSTPTSPIETLPGSGDQQNPSQSLPEQSIQNQQQNPAQNQLPEAAENRRR